MADWELYEQQIYEKFKNSYSDCEFTKNDKIVGQYSKVQRQIDVAVRGTLAGYPQLLVIECKYFNKHVDVKVVDSFIGFLEDVNANHGVIITNNGFSEAAQNRAKGKKINLDVVDFNHFDDYEFEPDVTCCHDCDPEYSSNFIYWDENYSNHEEFRLSYCNYCSQAHIRCTNCGSETSLNEAENDILECSGGCGLKIKITHEYVGSGQHETQYEVIYNNEEEIND